MGVRRPRWACGAVALVKGLAWACFVFLALMKPPIAPFIFLAFLCGRFTKMVEVAVRVLRRIIAMLLAKHQRLHVMPMPQGAVGSLTARSAQSPITRSSGKGCASMPALKCIQCVHIWKGANA